MFQSGWLIPIILLLYLESAQTTEVITSINKVGLELLKYTPSTANIMISPYSINTAIAMVNAGAKKSTKDQINEAFSWSDDTMMGNYKDLISSVGSKSTAYNLSSSNRLYVDNLFEVKQQYKTDLAKYFGADSQDVNFSQGDNSATVDLINNWVAGQTNQKIKKMFNELDNRIVAIIINTIYFKASWYYPFDEYLTTDEVFYLDKEYAVKTKMMKVEKSLGYYKNSDVEMVKLPYKLWDTSTDEDRQISMIVIKPIARGELESVEKNLINYQYSEVSTWMSKMEYRRLSLSFPKFEFNAGIDCLKDILMENYGVVDLFTDDADLTGISDSIGLRVSKIIHKSYIYVGENGTEAAAATAATAMFYSGYSTEPQVVMINQPFMFLIYDETNELVLFVGRLVIPDESLLESKFVEKDFNNF